MLKLINIKKNNIYIEADYIPEDSDEIGYVKVDFNEKKILESRLTSFDEIIATYRRHAFSALLKLANTDIMPERYPVAWY
jgi:hypothetical protein